MPGDCTAVILVSAGRLLRGACVLTLTVFSTVASVGWPAAAVGEVPLLDAFGQSDTRFISGDRDVSGFAFNPDGLGDVDGDGADDVTFGLSVATGNEPQGSLVVPGRRFRSVEAVSQRDPGAFRVIGGTLGIGLRAAGDVNGDGVGDMLADGDDLRTSYVIFGRRQATDVKLSRLGDRGFAMTARLAETEGVAGAVPAGDVNGDGRDDLLLTATQDDGSGFATVVFGESSTSTVDVAAPGARGFRIDGLCNGTFDDGDFVNPSGFSAAGPGDVNGDALADVVIGSDRRDSRINCTAPRRGEVLVVFGKNDTLSVDSRNLGPGGTTFTGPPGTGASVQPAGDVNGDTRPDFSVQTPAGVSVVLGAASLGGGHIEGLGRGGILIRRARGFGAAPAALGDLDGDGLADIGVGNHVVYGVGSKREILLDDLEGGGFRIRQTGSFLQDATPGRLTSAGDPDGDTRAELFVESESAAGVDRAYLLDADGLPQVVVAPFRRAIAVLRGRVVRVRALCPATAVGRCSGHLRVSIGSRTLLASRLRIPAGRTVLISRRLGTRQRRLVARHADKRVLAVVRAKDRRGQLARTARRVKLRTRP